MPRENMVLATSEREVERGVAERVEALGYELVQLERAGSSRRPVLRIRIDCGEGDPAGGVTVDDCALVSREIEAWLEGAEQVPERYVLEVSSPGVDRPLTRPRDWIRFSGERVFVKTKSDVAGHGRRVEGTIMDSPASLGAEPTAVSLCLDNGEVVSLDLDGVERAHLVFDWDRRG